MQICKPNSRSFRLQVLLSLVCLIFLQSGCERCSGDLALARLSQATGNVDRDVAGEQEQWFPAEAGAKFFVNEAIRTRTAGRAHLELDDGSNLELEENTLIRFLDREPGQKEQALDLVMGEASLEAPEKGTAVRTEFGLARLIGGSKVRLVRSEDTLRYRVMVGQAQLEDAAGNSVSAAAGQTVIATVGQAVVEVVETAADEKQQDQEGASRNSGPIRASVLGAKVTLTPPGEAPRTLPAGSQSLAAGSLLEIGADSSASVSRGGQSAKLRPGGSYVVGEGDQLVRATKGSFVVSSKDTFRVVVPGGVIITQAGAATIFSEGAEGTRVIANSGRVTLSGKETEQLSAGQEGRIRLDGAVQADGRGLARFDVSVTEGGNLVIHDPAPPTAIGFQLGTKCPRAVVRLQGKKSALVGPTWARGSQRINLPLGAGRANYTVSCVGEQGEESDPHAQGVITIFADAGTRAMPRRAPSTSVDVNGRAYTVLYQNQLPSVTVRWPGAPSADSYTLYRSTRGASKSYATSAPNFSFRSGSLAEGTHTFYFQGSGRVSRRSSVSIRFDNATPTASLETPANVGVGPGGAFVLKGRGLSGWKVVVDAKPVAQDAEGRFSVKTTMPADGRPATVHLTHPHRGSHIYLRRPTGAN